MKIYSNHTPGHLLVDLCQVVANLSKVELTEVVLTEEQTKSKEFKSKSLTGKYPMLETENGVIVESAAIAKYIASLSGSGLSGKDQFESAQIDQFIDFTLTAINPHAYAAIAKGIFGRGPIDADTFNNSVKELKEQVRVLNTHLQGKTYLVGERLTVADIITAFALMIPFQTVLDGGFRKSVAPNVTSWLEKIFALPEVVKRVGHVKFSQKPLKPVTVAAAKEEKKAAPKKEEAPKEQAEVKKKEGDPLDDLPPSPFVLPDFKTYFVNLADKKGEGMNHFFANYDPNGYSIYYAKYDKYEGEGTVLYQTSNLMNGFMQRIDEKFRRHAFAMMAIVGEEPNLDIESVWLFRGKGIPAQMLEHPQFEYYNKRELDINNEDDKKLMSEFFTAKVGETVNGKTVQECKMYK